MVFPAAHDSGGLLPPDGESGARADAAGQRGGVSDVQCGVCLAVDPRAAICRTLLIRKLHPPCLAGRLDARAWLQGVSSRDIKLENALLDGSPRPLIKVRRPPGHRQVASSRLVRASPSAARSAEKLQTCLGILGPLPTFDTVCRPSMPAVLGLSCPPVSLAALQLADFGFSKDANDQSAPTSRVGTPAYLAPEVISNRMGQVCSRVYVSFVRKEGLFCEPAARFGASGHGSERACCFTSWGVQPLNM